MPTLSLAMIVKNEETFLGHCLASVQGLVDEIVVVDTGSSDATVAIARQAGARVFQLAWADDFAAARNAALGHCQGDWVLILDADEALDPLDFPQIRQACGQDPIPAFRLVLRNYLLSGTESNLDQAPRLNTSAYAEGAQYQHYADTEAIRLCRRLPGLAFRGRIHELLAPFFQDQHLPIGSLPAVVHHYGKTAADREQRKLGYYLELAKLQVQANPGDYQAQFNLVNAALAASDWAQVLAAGAACRALLPGFAEPLVLLGMGMAHQHQGEPGAGLACLEELLRAQPDHPLALVRQALSLALLGRVEPALAALRKATALQPGFTLAWLNLSEIQAQLGSPEAARATLGQGLAVLPRDGQLLNARIRLDLQMQRIDLALEDARAAIAVAPVAGQGLWHRLVATDLLRQGQPEPARLLLNQALSQFPADPDLARLLSLCPPC